MFTPPNSVQRIGVVGRWALPGSVWAELSSPAPFRGGRKTARPVVVIDSMVLQRSVRTGASA
jgi:hypothetical protein